MRLALRLLAVVAPQLACSAVSAQTGPRAYTFHTVVGVDTVAIEQVVRTTERIDVDLFSRAQGVRFVFTVELGEDGTAVSVENRFFRQPADEEPTQVVRGSFRGDSVDVEIRAERDRDITVATVPGAVPWVPRSNALLEQILLQSDRASGGIDSVPVFNIGNGQTTFATVEWLDGGDARLQFAEAELRVEVSGDGEFVTGSMVGSPGRVVRENAFGGMPVEPVDYGPPAGAPYSADEVAVRTSTGLSLSGTLTQPIPDEQPWPAVVTITGSGAQDRDERTPGLGGYRPYWELADTLARLGVATLRLDDRGVNDSDEGPQPATLWDEADDIRAAVDFVRRRPEVDGERVFLVGHSQGGLIAPLVAADDPTLAGIVLLAAPGYDGNRTLEAQRWANLDPRFVEEHERADAVMRSRRADSARAVWDPALRALMTHDPIPVARRVHVPVLILQGSTDRQVTPEQADTLAAALRSAGNTDVTVRHFDGLNHFLLPDARGYSSGYGALRSTELPREVLGVVADWILARACTAGEPNCEIARERPSVRELRGVE